MDTTGLPWEESTGELSDIKKLCSEIGSTISNVLQHILVKLEDLTSSIMVLRISVDSATTSLSLLLQQLPNGSTGAETLSVISSIATIFSTLLSILTAGFAAAAVAGSSWIGIIIAAVVTAIILIIAYWDEIAQFFTELWQKITTMATQIWDGIVAVFSAVAQWIQNEFIPTLVQFFTQLWQDITAFALNAWETISNAFSEAAAWFSENVIQPITAFFVQLGTSIAEFATNAWNAICDTFSAVGTWIYENVIKPVGSFLADMWNGFLQGALDAWEGIKSAFSAVAGFFGDIFSKAWAAVVKVFDIAGDIFVNIKDGILSVFKTIVNGLIDGINAVVAIPFKGINGALSIIKNIEIVGITPFSDLRLLSIPQIPHLAQGAVLPANRPFMAIVGDQRHGTNVEAPLATIQEAVAIVMEDQTQAIVAGFNASIGVQRELLSAVLGIRIGDEVIGRAADRYFAKRAAMGGY